MSVTIRLVPHGRKKQRTYRIRSGERRRKLTGVYAEELGWYDPAASEGQGVVGLRREGYLTALNNGAQPSPTLKSLIRRGLNGSGPILQLIPEETRDSAGGPVVEVPITPRRSHSIQASLRIPDPLAGDRTAGVDRLIEKTPVAQFVLRSNSSEVMTVFVDIQGQDTDWARASFRWKTGVPATAVWAESLTFMKRAAGGAPTYVSFESDGELLEPTPIDWTKPEQELDAAVMALRSVSRIYLFTAGTEITIESAPRGHVLAVAVENQAFHRPASREAVLALLNATLAANHRVDERNMAGALDAVASRARPAARTRAAVRA